MPTTPGEYVIEVFPVTDGGTFSVYLSAGKSDTADVPDVTPPDPVVVVAPLNFETVAAPVSVSGTASDDVGLSLVRVELRDRVSGLWWDGSTWQVPRQSFDVPVDTPGAAASGWSFGFDPEFPSSQPYWVTLRAVDQAGNASGYVYTNFTIGAPVDVTPPDPVVVVAPLNFETVAAPVSVSGTASDDVGLSLVRVELRDRVSGLWWDGSTWQVPRQSFDVPVDTPGAAASGWSFGFDPEFPSSQPYWVTLRAVDEAGNASGYVYTNFTIGAPVDVTPPDPVVVVAPLNFETVAAPVSVSGTASDDVGLSLVRVELRDRVSGLWWDGSTWQVPRQSFDVPVDTPGAAASGWSFGFNPEFPSSQPYWVTLRAVDEAGNASSYVYTNFTIGAPVDVTPPDPVVVVAPLNFETVAAPVTVSGTASDDVGLSLVRVELRDRVSGLWWDGSTWQVPRVSFDVPVDTPGAAVSGWSFGFNPEFPSSQPYWVTLRAVDEAGNASGYVYTNFRIEP
jgi:hypothetical protein